MEIELNDSGYLQLEGPDKESTGTVKAFLEKHGYSIHEDTSEMDEMVRIGSYPGFSDVILVCGSKDGPYAIQFYPIKGKVTNGDLVKILPLWQTMPDRFYMVKETEREAVPVEP